MFGLLHRVDARDDCGETAEIVKHLTSVGIKCTGNFYRNDAYGAVILAADGRVRR